ncbi:MAG: hypothetical protein K0R14_1660 [Burkholderiales bacterium]|jgi:hypothetical protein|nr:hypothetical protein [Burkholderiales bacterium]
MNRNRHLFSLFLALFLCINLSQAEGSSTLVACYYKNLCYLQQHPGPVIRWIVADENGTLSVKQASDADMKIDNYGFDDGRLVTLSAIGSLKRPHTWRPTSVFKNAKWSLERLSPAEETWAVKETKALKEIDGTQFKQFWEMDTGLHRVLKIMCTEEEIQEPSRLEDDEFNDDYFPELTGNLSNLHVVGDEDEVFTKPLDFEKCNLPDPSGAGSSRPSSSSSSSTDANKPTASVKIHTTTK